ncbi:wall-associated receptor kinase-like 20 [Heracleum sosnowskyi]|uniref:Wall-associated receptor kinase-like 20 n=1 Tax=Heracleum sosnowskyi TaxID=360622 RepID=A0AAD8NCI1_9APIA|nr:wall-associated receptor kinase-like 20 [Heracleum sosnowskyi]
MITRPNEKPADIVYSLLFLVCLFSYSSAMTTCPNCGSTQVPYPLSTSNSCGDPEYSLRCEPHTKKLYFDALNGTSYIVLKINASIQRMVLQPSSWIPGTCVTQDMVVSEGLWLNQTLPFNLTSSNTIFLFNCSPRLLASPLNCTPSSTCHKYLESSGHVDATRAVQCSNGPINPCCTFISGGMPSAYKIRLHNSGCRAFRSILGLNSDKPASQWEEGLEIQWAAPPEPVCKSQMDCSATSKCLPAGNTGVLRCQCNTDYHWNHVLATCMKKKKSSKIGPTLKISIAVVLFFVVAFVMSAISMKKSGKFSNRAKLVKAREEMLQSSSGCRSARMFSLKDIKKATNGFSKDKILGVGGFGEVYKGELRDGSTVAIKSAKVGNIKSTQQVLNEVAILSQVSHQNLVRLLGCCVEAEQPLMIYEYISNGTLHDHIHGKFSSNFLNWKSRLRIALQTAEALAYLHSAAYTPIYHRDVKSTNILLDVLLEILTSQKAIDFSRNEDDVNLAIYASQRENRGAILEILDQRLLGEDHSVNLVTSLKLFSDLAFSCLREKKGERPSMKNVVQQLECIIEMVTGQEFQNQSSPVEASSNDTKISKDGKLKNLIGFKNGKKQTSFNELGKAFALLQL